MYLAEMTFNSLYNTRTAVHIRNDKDEVSLETLSLASIINFAVQSLLC